MIEEQIALAKRAVACKHWRWMSGMLRGDGFRCTWVDEDERELAAPTWCANGIEWKNSRTGSKDLPDLTDPATLGCLLALVREAWDQKSITSQVVSNKKWLVIYKGFGTPSRFFYGTTEVEVLVTTLEAAP
jgi:hypothetical protein